MASDVSYYPRNVSATMLSAGQGFLWGNGIALLLVALTLPFRRLQALVERLAVGAVALPLIAVAPLLTIAFNGDTPSVILAAQASLFPTTVAAILGLRSADRASVEVVIAAGGSAWTALRKVRLPAAVPSIITGLQVAAPSAILGAIIGEYMGGVRGLGVAMIQAQGSFNVPRAWGLAIVTAAVAAVAYAVIPLVAKLLFPRMTTATTQLGSRADEFATHSSKLRGILQFLGAVLVTIIGVLIVWWIAAQALPGGGAVARGPGDVLPYLFNEYTQLVTSGNSEEQLAVNYLIDSLSITLVNAGIGFVVGLVAAILMAVLAFHWPIAEQALMPISITLRSVPIVAAMPLLALIFGRGLLAVTVLVTIMTFFPTLVNLLLAMRQVPPSASDVFTAYGAGGIRTTMSLHLPYAIPALLASVKIALPLSIGAAMVAEWLATGEGLGATMTVAATLSDYNFVWAGVAAVLCISLLVYLVAAKLESIALHRLS
ncbi:ABC transporter permease [Corynebacterium sp. AOP40-9SA-29]|uniref:ABC transporter permease n=1 Tax=Corynebacterium sp. AOP40-9SA-29 TaxID=3457677 RepID=UPI004034AB48